MRTRDNTLSARPNGPTSRLIALVLALLAAAVLAACTSDTETDDESSITEPEATSPDETGDGTSTTTADTGSTTASYDGPVTELAIRQLDTGTDLDDFTARRDDLVSKLTDLAGVGTDREFEAFLDGTTFGPLETPVFTGMTEYENLDAFQAAAATLGDSEEAAAFGQTFEPLVFTALRPKIETDRYTLADIAPEPGQVLEIAVRDLSTYADFDQTAYENGLTTFLDALTAQEGVVAEYQWVSVLDPNLVVGMTVYESADAFASLAANPELLAAAGPFASSYPATVGFIHEDARRTTVPGSADPAAPVIQLAVRQPVDFDSWRTNLAAINSGVSELPVITGLAEYEPILALAPADPDTGQPMEDLYFTLISVTNEADLGALQAQLAQNPDAQTLEFLSTFTPIASVNIQPYRDTPPIDVEEFLQPGQVLEVAIRDVRGFPSFEAFDAVRAAAVSELLALPGVVGEYEFRSTDGNHYVGMTIYESAEAFEAIAATLSDPSPAFQALFEFPPDVNVYGVTFDPAAG